MPTDTFFLRDVPQTPKEPIRAETMSHPKRNSRARATDQHVLSIKKWQKTAWDGLAQARKHIDSLKSLC